MDYKISYSKRKTIALRVLPDLSLEVKAPFGVSRRAIDEIVSRHSSWINKKTEEIKAQPPTHLLTKGEIDELKAKTKEIVLPLVEKYAALMNVEPTQVKFTSAKRVFGSCTAKRHLNFSFRLSLYPIEAIEYVVVHELCHIKEMNHSARFWSEVGKILPDYKERRRLLKEKI